MVHALRDRPLIRHTSWTLLAKATKIRRNKNKAQQKFHPLKPLNYGQFKFSKLWVKLCVNTGEA